MEKPEKCINCGRNKLEPDDELLCKRCVSSYPGDSASLKSMQAAMAKVLSQVGRKSILGRE
jgi:uncharacterized membrane protein YvbJ